MLGEPSSNFTHSGVIRRAASPQWCSGRGRWVTGGGWLVLVVVLVYTGTHWQLPGTARRCRISSRYQYLRGVLVLVVDLADHTKTGLLTLSIYKLNSPPLIPRLLVVHQSYLIPTIDTTRAQTGYACSYAQTTLSKNSFYIRYDQIE